MLQIRHIRRNFGIFLAIPAVLSYNKGNCYIETESFMNHRFRKIASFIIIAAAFAVLIPFLSPVQAASEKIVIVLDAGHGGIDGGTDLGIRTEKEYNLILTQYVAEALRNNGNFDVILTRSDDTYLKFLPRALFALENNADVLISLHCNSSEIPDANGALAIISKIEPFSAYTLAGNILDSISNAVGLTRRNVETRADTGDSLGVYYWNSDLQWDMPAASHLGQTSDYFSINTWASKFGVPSIIVEHGYLSNASDRELLDKDENLRAIANAEAQAIIDYYTGHTHQFPASPTVDHPSNCTLTGTQSYRCTICGMRTGTTSLDPASGTHYWRETASQAATCTDDGYIEYICQISDNLNSKGYACEVHTQTVTVAAKGHNYQVIEDTPASHGRDGRYLQKCANCGDTMEEVRPGEPHSYEITADTEPTCTDDGGITYTCSVCTDSYTEEKPAIGHNYQETDRKDIYGDENGYIKYTCANCGGEKEEILHACEHVYADRTETPASCETDGRICETCTICGYVREEILPAPGHSLTVMMDVLPDCDSEGYYRAECRVCGHKILESRPALGHTYTIKEETGTHIVKACSRCASEITEEIPHRSLLTLFSHPVTAAIFGIILIQLIAIPVIVLHHRHHQKKLHQARLRRTSYLYEDESDELTDVPANETIEK